MIDVVHPSQLRLSQAENRMDDGHADSPDSSTSDYPEPQQDVEDAEDPEEAAWLESIESAQLDTVQVPQRGTLVMDISLLRDSQTQRSVKTEPVC